jgi:hypothetical protein
LKRSSALLQNFGCRGVRSIRATEASPCAGWFHTAGTSVGTPLHRRRARIRGNSPARWPRPPPATYRLRSARPELAGDPLAVGRPRVAPTAAAKPRR